MSNPGVWSLSGKFKTCPSVYLFCEVSEDGLVCQAGWLALFTRQHFQSNTTVCRAGVAVNKCRSHDYAIMVTKRTAKAQTFLSKSYEEAQGKEGCSPNQVSTHIKEKSPAKQWGWPSNLFWFTIQLFGLKSTECLVFLKEVHQKVDQHLHDGLSDLHRQQAWGESATNPVEAAKAFYWRSTP